MLKVQSADVRFRLFECGQFFLILMGAGLLAPAAFADVVEPAILAVADFEFRDTSGEVRDQTAAHEARLKAFGVALQDGLSQKIDLVALPCQAEQCTIKDPGLVALSKQARTASAKYLLIGQVHKMSTLVGWVKFAVLDLNDNKPVCDRYLTYRGDTDEAWRRAAEFTARDVEKHCIP
ncbi:DUF2380 domain-containing protein [Mesorhizobium sp.]|uniref:DUF2380 domain-containing protein n=1 Tax=Mesorhizobium sp. TaxID=1871066 RepID=UPI000FE69670|nr:DUF2380 domain-containing protein [Mesorhizobium sp.]RWK65078.1 MAG: DUF2380 domain-containing protein [Mesorhizobium sp.]RWM43234.1 MAG: DUF2380 domain-containing protein [Mesorhizobium sp.]RWM56422.1 MAG: DUF2380 domain-containing protein [Mesorhizobium sp.]RWM60947.1 MAG: DUF2380 domain-containing protein [Mesorhizobium sp.]RWN05322.1 MAG: DUF2380 domain-containing protein [Mesorhizobium sp.]